MSENSKEEEYKALLEELHAWLKPESGSHFPHGCKAMFQKLQKALS